MDVQVIDLLVARASIVLSEGHAGTGQDLLQKPSRLGREVEDRRERLPIRVHKGGDMLPGNDDEVARSMAEAVRPDESERVFSLDHYLTLGRDGGIESLGEGAEGTGGGFHGKAARCIVDHASTEGSLMIALAEASQARE